MQFGSKIKRNIFLGSIIGLVPDALIAWVAASMTESGVIGFFAVLVGLQIVYLLVWSRKAIWAWLMFWLFRGRKKMADHLFEYLRSNGFPEPGEYQDDVDDYLGSVMGNEKVSVDVRLKAAGEMGALNGFRLSGQGTRTLQTVLAFEDAIQRYKRTFPPRGSKDTQNVQSDELDKLEKGTLVTCEVVAVTDSGLKVKLLDHDVTSFIRPSDLSRDRSEQRPDRFGVGEMFDAVVTQVDTNARKVGVSIKALEIAEEEEAVAQYHASTDSGASLSDILDAALSKVKEEDGDDLEKDQKAALAVKINKLASN
jgi:predicted RNA-binding protein with RPS1 domain